MAGSSQARKLLPPLMPKNEKEKRLRYAEAFGKAPFMNCVFGNAKKELRRRHLHEMKMTANGNGALTPRPLRQGAESTRGKNRSTRVTGSPDRPNNDAGMTSVEEEQRPKKRCFLPLGRAQKSTLPGIRVMPQRVQMNASAGFQHPVPRRGHRSHRLAETNFRADGRELVVPKTRRAASRKEERPARAFLGALLAELVPDDQGNDENEDGKGRIPEGNRHITRPGEGNRRYNL